MMILGLVVVSAGCASLASPTVTTLPTVTLSPLSALEACESEKVTVTDVHSFKDAKGAWRVVGVISNHSSEAVGKLVTAVEMKDKTGQPAGGRGEDVSAYPLNLQPDAQSPFIAWIDREIPGLDHFKVIVEECVLAEQAERGQVEVRAGQMVVDDNGLAQVTAELFNPGSKPVLINGLMAGVYNQMGALVAADNAVVATRYLMPGESGPVRATLDLPPGGAGQIKSYHFFMDVLISEPGPLILDIHDVQIISRYTDADGHFHLVGQITNPGSKGMMASLQATIYTDSKKSVVADTTNFDTWIPLGPGETLPFDLTEWGALNNTRGLWDELAKQNAAIELRLEPFRTWTVDARLAKLSLVENSVSFKDRQAIFTGKTKIESSITTGLVTAVVHQKLDGTLVATGGVHLDIVGSTAAGQTLDYSFIIQLPANLDPADLETEVTALGN